MRKKQRVRARRSRILPIVSRLDIDLKFVRSDFGEPGFFSKGEISATDWNSPEITHINIGRSLMIY